MKKYLNYYFITGIVMCVLGVIALCKQHPLFLADFICGIVLLWISYTETNKKG